MRNHFAGAVAALACLQGVGTALAHGVVGARSFIEPFVTEDVNPKNEFVIARPEYDYGRDARVLAYGFGLEKKLADDFSLTLDSAWLHASPKAPGEPNESGFGNLGITAKYAFFRNEEHEAIAAVAVEATAPTGSRDVGAERDWSFRPFVLYGKGLGDLPNGLGWLRPIAFQGDFGPEIAADSETTTAFVHDLAIQYSIPYLQSSVKDLGLPWPLANLIPVVELNFEHRVRGAESGATAIFATAGVVYMDRWVELGIAGRFALTDSAREELDPRVIVLVDLFIDDIAPWTRWQLL